MTLLQIAINRHSSEYVIGFQQDAREYLTFLENLLNEDLSSVSGSVDNGSRFYPSVERINFINSPRV